MRKISKKSLITLVELPPTEFGELLISGDGNENGKLSHNVYSHFRMPSRALHILEAILRKEGYENVQSIIPIYHGDRGRLSKENIPRMNNSDAVLVSSITPTAPQSAKLVKMIKEQAPDIWIIAGGFDPTIRPCYWLKAGVDVIAMREGELVVPELMQALEKGEALDSVKGLILGNGKYTGFRDPPNSKQLVSQPHPYYDKKVREMARIAVLETSRGCLNNCDFCGINGFYYGEDSKKRKYRKKSIDYIIEELEQIKNMGKAIFWTADSFSADRKYTLEILNAIGNSGIIKSGIAQATTDIDLEVLRALKKAGIEVLCIGTESLNDQSLVYLGKPYTAMDNINGLKRIEGEGLARHVMTMPGGDGDTPDSLKRDLEYYKRYATTIQFFPPGPVPGTKLRKNVIRQGRLLRNENEEHWELYNGHFVLARPKNFSPYELQETLNQMHREFYTEENFQRMRNSDFSPAVKLIYSCIDKGVKAVLESEQMKAHLEFLKSLE